MDARAPSRSAITVAKPYRGTDSYAVEHTDLFFGREREAEELVRKILCTRFTLLYAPSGAGKTSLVNARAIPGLERHDCLPVVIRVEDHPINATKTALLRSVIPDPGAEAMAMKRAITALELDADTGVSEVLAAYRSLDVSDERRIRLISPVRVPALPTDVEDFKRVSPFFCRYLRGCMRIKRLGRYYRPLLGHSDLSQGAGGSWLSAGLKVSELLTGMEHESAMLAYQSVVSEVGVPGMTLSEFAENLFAVWGKQVGHLSIVMIFDQFEEIFTRFVDEGKRDAVTGASEGHWGKRWKFFRELEGLYQETGSGTDYEDDADQLDEVHLPIRFVVSMREEYIARLQPLRAFVTDLDRSSYYLGFLSKEGARLAIEEPARACGCEFPPDIPNNIISELAREDRFVHPAPLQIVCSLLWREQQAETSESSWASRFGSRRASSAMVLLRSPGGVTGILRAFFDEFLERPEGDEPTFANDEDRLEILEMLQPLITSSRTRNIVEVGQLTDVPFRDFHRRRRMLKALEDGNIIRIEERSGSQFAEIKHEFLIDPILATVREKLSSNEVHTRFRVALRLLQGLERQDRESGGRRRPSDQLLDDPSVVLRNHDYQALNTSRSRVKWTDWSMDLMLRSAVFRGSRADIAHWAREVSSDDTLWEAVEVVHEFVISDTKLVRERAARALAALGTAESISRLIRLAVDDERGTVRRAAEVELAKLDGPPEQHLVNQLAAVLLPEQGVSVDVTNPWHVAKGSPASGEHGWVAAWARLRHWWAEKGPFHSRRSPVGDAYMLLGRLRRYGSDLELPKPGTLRRIQQVWTSRHSLARHRRFEQAWRESLTPSLVGAAIGILAFGAYLINGPGFTQSSNAITLMIVTVPLVAPLLAFFATRRVAPLCDETYPVATIFMAAGGAVVPALLVMVGLLVNDPGSLVVSLLRALIVGVALSVYLVGIRTATLIAHGIVAEPRRNQWVQTSVGGGAGVIIATLFTYLPTKIALAWPRLESFVMEEFAILVWFMLVPSAVGIAHAFSSQDRIGLMRGGLRRSGDDTLSGHFPKQIASSGDSGLTALAMRAVEARPVVNARRARMATWAVAAVGVGLLLLPLWGVFIGREDATSSPVQMADGNANWTADSIPWRAAITVAAENPLELVVQADKQNGFQLVFELYHLGDGDRRDLVFTEHVSGGIPAPGEEPERIARALEEPGVWELQVFRRANDVDARPPAWCNCAWNMEELFFYFVDMAPPLFGAEYWGGRYDRARLGRSVGVTVKPKST